MDRRERWKRVEALFEQALERPPTERSAWLAETCPEEPGVAAEVERMLAAHEQPEGLLDRDLFGPGGAELPFAALDGPAGPQAGGPSGGEAGALSPGLPDDGPATVGPYRVVREVGRGGMGVVYEGWDERLRRRVALKLLPPSLHADGEARRRFLDEARAASALEHPAICTVYDLGETEDGRQYIAMAFYPGRTLHQVTEAGPVPVDRAVDWTIQAASGLARAHAAGIVHRDVKPANLLLTDDGRIKILDFGVAKLTGRPGEMGHGAGLTLPGARIGTPAYMAPEQARGEPADPRSDLFSLGAMLYELLTGRRPFAGETTDDAFRAVLTEEPPPLSDLLPGAPPELERIVGRCLAKERAARYATADELVQDLEALRSAGGWGGDRLRLRPQASAGAPRAARPAPETNADLSGALPAAVTRLIGREREVHRVVELLEGTRLLTLTGPGGTGKTRLALAAAWALTGRRSGRMSSDAPTTTKRVAPGEGPPGDEPVAQARFVSLAALREPAAVAPTLCAALGVPESVGRTPEQALRHALSDRNLLLVLDNFEQVAEAAALVGELLACCPGLRFLVTSRVVLRLQGERVFPVPPLGLPEVRDDLTLEDLERHPATALFLDRTRSARGELGLADAEAPAVAEICRRLDGLPLAIELAAARTRHFSPRSLLSRLGRRLDLPARGPRDLPERHQTLRRAIAWSYGLLEEPEQALFRRLGVFAGGFDLDAADAVCGACADDLDVLEGLTVLLDHSLLQRSAAGRERFVMLDTLRELALEALEEAGERQETERAHAVWAVAFAERAEPELTGPGQGRWLARLKVEADNLRSALEWALDGAFDRTGKQDARTPEDTVTALRLGAALWRYWLIRGQLRSGHEKLERLAALPGAADHPALLARVLQGLGTLASNLGDNRSAFEHLEASLELFRTLNDRRGLASQLNNLGWVAAEAGELDRARELSEEALALNREVGDRRGEALAWNNLGWVALYRSEYATAREHLRRSLELRREVGDRRGTAFALSNLAWAEERTGRFDRAADRLREAEEILTEIGDRMLPGWTLNILALVAQGRGDHRRALAALERGNPLWAEAENPSGLALAFGVRATSLAALGRAEEARETGREAEELAERVGSPWLVAGARLARARAELAGGDAEGAGRRAAEALELFGRTGDRRGEAEAREVLAAVARRRGEEGRAAELAAAAAELRRRIDAPPRT